MTAMISEFEDLQKVLWTPLTEFLLEAQIAFRRQLLAQTLRAPQIRQL